MIDLRYVKKLIEMLDGSSVDSIEISTDKGMKIRISKSPSQRGAVQVADVACRCSRDAGLARRRTPAPRKSPTPIDGVGGRAAGEAAARRRPSPSCSR